MCTAENIYLYPMAYVNEATRKASCWKAAIERQVQAYRLTLRFDYLPSVTRDT